MQVSDIRNEGSLGRGSKIKGGCVRLRAGESIGEHSTENGEEFILVIEGEATVTTNGTSRKVIKNQALFIPSGTVHNVLNQSDGPLHYLYFVGGKD